MCLTHDPGIIAVTSCKYYFCIGDILGNAQNLNFINLTPAACLLTYVYVQYASQSWYTQYNYHQRYIPLTIITRDDA